MEEIVKQVAESVEKEANARAVFGQAVKLERHTVIPVASVNLGGGGGGAMPGPRTPALVRALRGGGAGMGLNVRPVGFIHEREGEVVFTPIHVDVANRPWLSELASGLGRSFDVLTSLAGAAGSRMLGRVNGAGRRTSGRPTPADESARAS
jgi:uncharacterized spore protein YtfJ